MSADDNQTELGTPFKGPFKGKGQNRKAVRELQFEMENIRARMEDIVGNFNLAFPSTPRVVNLRILKRGAISYPLMWWRQTCSGGSFFLLFNSEPGQRLLSQLMPRSVELLAKFDRERLMINWESKVIGSTLDAYKVHMNGIAHLEAYQSNDAAMKIYH